MAGHKTRIGGAPLRGPMRVLAVTLCGVYLLFLLRLWFSPPIYEAHAVIQVRPGALTLPVIESRLLTRETLELTAQRQGLASALQLTEAVALHPLTTRAGESLGLPPQTIGLVLAVRLGDADTAVRVANDLALQVMDLGAAGQIDARAEALGRYRAEEDRLWQEIAALQSDPGLDAAGRRKLGLMEEEYAAVRHDLAEEEVAARVQAKLGAAPYILLARAETAVSLTARQGETMTILAASALLLALLSTVIGREVTLPFRPIRSADSARSRSS